MTTRLTHLFLASLATPLFAAEPQAIRGPSTNLDPFVLSSVEGSKTVSILSAEAGEPLFDGYRMMGQPDGLGTFDNGDGTFTVLMNHWMIWAPPGLGAFDIDTPFPERAHGGKGSFISKWVINKPSHPEAPWEVQSGTDLITDVQLWDKEASEYTSIEEVNLSTISSSTLAPSSAFFNETTGKGTRTRLYTTGEEFPPFTFGPALDRTDGGRAFAVAVDGTDAGTAFEIPRFGNMPFENVVPNPHPQDLTVILIPADEDFSGRLYLYVGTKTTEGNDIDRAGLTNGAMYGLVVDGKTQFPDDTFVGGESISFVALPDLTNVDHNERERFSSEAGLTQFADLEDADWDGTDPSRFYFATNGTKGGDDVPTRLWRVTLTDIANPILGGVIDVVVDGTDPTLRSFDNIGVDHEGNVLIQEDDDSYSERLAKVWRYRAADGLVEEVAAHNPVYFTSDSPDFLSTDDESSGVVDVSEILGEGWYLLSSIAHLPGQGDPISTIPNIITDPPIYGHGQLVAMYLPPTQTLGKEVTVYPLGDSSATDLHVELENEAVTIAWDGEGELEVSESLRGPWQPITRTSPHVRNAEGDVKFYRVASQLDRPASVYIPGSYDPEIPMPLIVSLHGYTDSPAGVERQIPLKPLADSVGFIYVVPEGPVGPTGLPFWNAMPEISNAIGSDRDDVGFLRGLVEGIRREYNVDEKRIYFVGHSNGGMMSYRMACEHSDLVAAIVSLAGATLTESAGCVPSEPVSILQIHGTADSIIPYNDQISALGIKFASARQNLDTWRGLNGCGELMTGDERTLDLDLNVGGPDSIVTSASACPAGVSVELWTIEGGSHSPRVRNGDEVSELATKVVDWLFSHPKS